MEAVLLIFNFLFINNDLPLGLLQCINPLPHVLRHPPFNLFYSSVVRKEKNMSDFLFAMVW